jgi:hypothetical protein
MSSLRRPIAAVLLACPFAVVVLGQTAGAPALDVRMGLWEVTNTVDGRDQMPAVDMSRMTPQQQAQMAAAVRGMMTPHTTTTLVCMTRADFDRKNFIADQDKNCRQTFTKNTPTELASAVRCSGDRAMSGTLHIEARTPTAYAGTITTSSTARGQGTTTVHMAGKWLAADCGDVK